MGSLFARARRSNAAHPPPPPVSADLRPQIGQPAAAETAVPKEAAKLRRLADIFRRKGRPHSAEMLIWAAAICENDPSESTIVGVLRSIIWAATRDQKP
jgi:hypothetical protein